MKPEEIQFTLLSDNLMVKFLSIRAPDINYEHWNECLSFEHRGNVFSLIVSSYWHFKILPIKAFTMQTEKQNIFLDLN